MKKKLIAFYREKDFYTLFYDEEENKLYKFSHKKRSFFKFFAAFFFILLGIRWFNDIYQPVKNIGINIALLLVIAFLSYSFAKRFLKNYYHDEVDEVLSYDNETMKQFAKKGIKQFRTELILTVVFGIILSIVVLRLFIISGQMDFLLLGGMGLVAIFVFTLMRPIKRYKILKTFENMD